MSTPTPLDIRAIAQRVSDRRKELRLEQTEVAERAGLSRAYVSRLEAGTVPNPKVFDLQRVAKVLDVTLVELIRQPPGTRTERYSAECTELMAQLEGVEPALADAVLDAWRQTMRIVRFREVAQNN